MKISINHLRRYKQIAMLLWKYGRSDLVQQMGIDGEPDKDEGQKNRRAMRIRSNWPMIWKRWAPRL